MLFLNISTDQVTIEINGEFIQLERNDIEDTIGPVLVDLFKKYKFSEVFLINGPGGFTNLRVGTLALNLLNSLENGVFDIYSISKIDFFKHFVDKNILPKKGIIYIGQKKNVRLYDFSKGTYETIKKDEINYDEDLFFDLVYENGYFEKDGIIISSQHHPELISLSVHSEGYITLTYNGKSFDTTIQELNIKPEKIVQAKYFIKPIMGKQGQ